MKRILLVSLAAVSTAALADDFDFGPASIPDNLPTGVTLTMALPAIQSVQSVTFFGLNHTWVGDIAITLITPDAVSHDLVYRIGSAGGTALGDSSNYLGDYTFIDGGANIWTEATLGGSTYNLTPGSYFASTIDGVAVSLAGIAPQAAGNWSIFAKDLAGGDVGGWQNARVTATLVPEPVSMIALGLGLAAMARRRRK